MRRRRKRGRRGRGGAYDGDVDDSTCMDGGQCDNNTALLFIYKYSLKT
jgi:hypothetical protein